VRRRGADGLANRAPFSQDNATQLAMRFPSSRPLEALRSNAGAQWVCLVLASIAFAASLEALNVSAALLIGPMIAGVIVASTIGRIRVPDTVFAATQGIIACMIARAMPASIVDEVAMQWPVFGAGVMSTIVMAAVVGWLLTRFKVLPGTSAIWGSAPGGAASMTVLAEAYGADVRLVAFMQYLRVMCVTSAASLVASAVGHPHPAGTIVWFPEVDWLSFAGTLAVASLGVISAKVFRIRAGAVLLPLVVGMVLSNTGTMRIELPPWFLAVSYAFLGWSIGLRFTRESVAHCARALPRVLAAILLLIAACAVMGQLLAEAAGVDPLTAYLATTPGGLDVAAIIASDSDVDVPFVLSMQFVRILIVLVTGPSLARFIASRSAEPSKAA
jgi:membrane AbrB-like protein